MSNTENEHKYDDIINLPHHVSKKHPQMSKIDRAAQFSPFSALQGHSEAIKETERTTTEKVELDEESKLFINEKLIMIAENISNQPAVVITYYKPDEHKTGGEYITVAGIVKRVDVYEKQVWLKSGEVIAMESIAKIK